MLERELFQEVDRIVSGHYHECPFPLETWSQRIEHLGFFVEDDAESIVKACAQLADAAELVAVLTAGGVMPPKYERWQGRVELCLRAMHSSQDETHRQRCEKRLEQCAKLADALQTIWRESQTVKLPEALAQAYA
jgi:hypothetical protein